MSQYPQILTPNRDNFRPYGKIIEYPNMETKGRVRNLWRIVHTENGRTGWRVAYLVLRDRTIGRLECHPHSDETFEPVRGKALIFTALHKDPGAVRCFVLDKPLILRKGVWHGLVTCSPETEIKITENSKITCRYWKLDRRISRPGELSA
ncbi:MAG: hypothetical protein KC900_13515 [Candidatus Omnitrophica bacterium]|nr:hypothetical protein [Candidatus Omnitrophota bacterium]